MSSNPANTFKKHKRKTDIKPLNLPENGENVKLFFIVTKAKNHFILLLIQFSCEMYLPSHFPLNMMILKLICFINHTPLKTY